MLVSTPGGRVAVIRVCVTQTVHRMESAAHEEIQGASVSQCRCGEIATTLVLVRLKEKSNRKNSAAQAAPRQNENQKPAAILLLG